MSVLRFRKNGVAEASNDIEPAGAPAPQSSDGSVISQTLTRLTENAKIAQNRLVNLGDPAGNPNLYKDLVSRYGDVQDKLQGLWQRLQGQSYDPNLLRDVDPMGVEVQQYIEAVEEYLGKHPNANGSAATANSKKLMPWFILGGAGLLVAAGGYLLWRQQQKHARAAARGTGRALAAVPARGKRK